MKIIRISSKNFNQVIEEVVKSIKKGQVVICPTDTIYGLIADATNEEAIKKILEIKKREDQKPLPIFIRNVKVAETATQISKKQQQFLVKVWPGKVTVVFKKRKSCNLPRVISGRTGTIGLRIPNHKLVSILLKKINKPLIGTSANISGRPGSTEIEKVLNQFKNQKLQPDLVIDAGNLKLSKPSAIVDLTRSEPKILRAGLFKKGLLNILK
jgi:L-threonylcarbamoyladenylate synthase